MESASHLHNEGRSQHRNNDLCKHFCLGERYTRVLTWMPDKVVPLFMFLDPPKPLLQCYSSEEVGPSKSVCQPFKRDCLNLWQSLCHSVTITTNFYSPRL